MAQVLSAIQQKGGAGKSTMLCSLAGFLGRDGARVVIVDTDRQRTCSDYHDRLETPNFDVLEVRDEEQITPVVSKLRSSYDFVLIDTAGIESQLVVYVAANSDIVLIPATPSRPDALGAVRTWKKIEEVRQITAGRPGVVKIVLTNYKRDARITANITKALNREDAPLYPVGLPSLTGFREIHTTGQLPQGIAGAALNQFVGSLQKDGILAWRSADGEAA